MVSLSSALAAEPRRDPDGVPLPDGCLARLGSTRFRAWDRLQGPWFTPAGELLFAEPDGEAVHFRFMDSRTGLFTRKCTAGAAEFAGHGTVQTVLGVSSDGTAFGALVVEAGTQQSHVVTWDIGRKRVVARVPVDVRSGVPPFADNLRWFAQFDRDTGDVTVTDARTGKAWPACRLDPDERPQLFPAPDGKSVVVGTDARMVLVAVPDGRPIREIAARTDANALSAMTAKFSADGGTVVARVSAGGKAAEWRCDARTGTAAAVPADVENEFTSAVSPDGKRLIVSGRNLPGEVLLDVASGRRADVFGSFRQAVRFDADGGRLVTNGPKHVTVHDAATGAPLTRPADTTPREVRFHDGGRTVAGFNDTTVSLFDAATGRERTRFDRPNEWRGLPFAGGRKVFAELPGGFALVDPLTGRRDPGDWRFMADAQSLTGSWEATACGRYVVAALGNDGATRVIRYNLATGHEEGQVHGFPIRFPGPLSLSRDGSRVTVGTSSFEGTSRDSTTPVYRVAVCDLQAGKGLPSPRSCTALMRQCLSADGTRMFLVASGLEFVLPSETDPPPSSGVYDVATGHLIEAVDPGTRAVLAGSPDGRAFAVGDADGRVRVIEAATGGVRCEFRHRDPVEALAFAPDSAALAAVSTDAPVYLWDVTGKLRGLPGTFDTATGERLWAALAGADTKAAFEAMRQLAAAPADAVTLFARRLPPAVAREPAWLAARVRELADPAFAVREKASAELAAVAAMIQPQLGRERDEATSPEVRRRLTRALNAVGSNTPERLRAIRAAEVLGWLRTPTATDLLKTWAGGATDAPLTAAAGQTLRR